MTTPTNILRDSAALLPVLVVVGGLLGGGATALAIGVTGAVALVNLALLGWMSADPTRFLLFATPKLLAVIAAVVVLVTFFDPLTVGLTFASVLGTVALAGMVHAARADQLAPVQET